MFIWLRSFAFYIWHYLSMGVLGVVFIPALFLPQKASIAAARSWAKATRFGLRFFCGVQTEIRGIENMPDGACLIASKHQSTYDILMPFIYAKNPAFVLKRELFFYPILGWYGWRADMIPIDRGGYVKTLKKMLGRAKEESQRGRQILIFPEGTRQIPGATPDYKSGVYAMYKELNEPCIPVALNTGTIWPRGSFMRRPGKLVFDILPAIEAGLPRKEFMQRLQDNIEPASNALLQEQHSIPSKLDEAKKEAQA
ncbi:lysophospholipid acyltransferase family protein [Hirschia baltica]|uniref:Phospholipid/glycerol acyltransferase n=1 Tax=Hirschia baltica (strain ATCC 49814 / DSM 5838 / IFAM 1418) TaxID=582402 RepID=C6XLM6_HIRBI|nr:lysophospholipid acyltransferase family protein [Hirschia baltica]ACT57932.1 phospholipid/glycerol acyltransferase [Hirschia baltica ATCC 49814]